MDDQLARLKAVLGDRYAIDRELGRGGMATVYLAQDLKHRRSVALKVLRPDLTESLGAERFLREIHTLANLQHPNILPLHDSGSVDGLLYFVMPYVEGETLRHRIDRERQLPLDEVVRIAGEVADGVCHAHGRGIIHRDIKPENILLSEDSHGSGRHHAVVSDFGIARAVSVAEHPQTQLTGIGISLGTPGYMSPEQAAGESTVDARSDEYALGCVVYEMLAGHPPFLGSTPQEIMARHARDPVPSLRTIRPDLPESVDRAVAKALAKAPADRFESIAGFIAALSRTDVGESRRRTRLRWSVGVLLAAAAVIAGYVTVRRAQTADRAGGTRVATARPSVAVLPFTNVGGDSANEPFSDGIADELTTALGRIQGLSVMARTSAFSFPRKGLDALEIGRRLKVRYVVVGRTRRAANRWRVGAQLIEVETGTELWADTFDQDAQGGDVFAAQDSITRSIVDRLKVNLSAATRATLAKRSTTNAAAHELYLQGRYFFARRDESSLLKAKDSFERAIEKDSMYALAYAGLADTYSHRSVFGYAPPTESFPKAKQYALRAVALDSTLVEAYASLAFIALFYEWDWPAAGRAFDRALALDSLNSPAHLYHAWYFVAAGRMNAAVEEFRFALQLDPFSDINNVRLATGLFFAHRYDEALRQANRVLELNPNFFQGHTEAARPYLELGRCAESLAEIEKSPEQRASILLGVRGYTYAKCGQLEKARAELDRLRKAEQQGQYMSHYGFAMIRVGLGETDRAFAELDSAYQERAWGLLVLAHEPAFDPMRSDPRFHVLMRKMNLTER